MMATPRKVASEVADAGPPTTERTVPTAAMAVRILTVLRTVGLPFSLADRPIVAFPERPLRTLVTGPPLSVGTEGIALEVPPTLCEPRAGVGRGGRWAHGSVLPWINPPNGKGSPVWPGRWHAQAHGRLRRRGRPGQPVGHARVAPAEQRTRARRPAFGPLTGTALPLEPEDEELPLLALGKPPGMTRELPCRRAGAWAATVFG